jgi:hypothetical protein
VGTGVTYTAPEFATLRKFPLNNIIFSRAGDAALEFIRRIFSFVTAEAERERFMISSTGDETAEFLATKPTFSYTGGSARTSLGSTNFAGIIIACAAANRAATRAFLSAIRRARILFAVSALKRLARLPAKPRAFRVLYFRLTSRLFCVPNTKFEGFGFLLNILFLTKKIEHTPTDSFQLSNRMNSPLVEQWRTSLTPREKALHELAAKMLKKTLETPEALNDSGSYYADRCHAFKKWAKDQPKK